MSLVAKKLFVRLRRIYIQYSFLVPSRHRQKTPTEEDCDEESEKGYPGVDC
jgi:hypothetical protein